MFLHGGGVDHHWWHPQITALAPDFNVIAPDLPGHGLRSARPFRIQQAVRDLEKILIDNDSSPVLIVGISLGGYLAVRFAALYPGRTCGLVLTGCSMNLNGLAGLGFKATGVFLKLRGNAWVAENTLKSFQRRVAPEVLGPAMPGGLYLSGATSAFGQVAGTDYHQHLRNYPHPVHILNGEEDEPNVAQQEKLLTNLRKGSLHELKHAGHLANLEQPEAYTAEIRRIAQLVF